MNRHLPLWFSLCVIILTSCQSVRPESKPVVTGSDSISSTSAATNNSSITSTASVTVGTEVAAAGMSSTTSETFASCPAITDGAIDISILAKWKVGEQRHYSIHKSRADLRGGEKQMALDATVLVTITVVSTDSNGYQLEWSYGKTEYEDAEAQLSNPLDMGFALPPQLRMRYSTKSDGSFVAVTNLEELQKQMITIFDQIFEELLNSGAYKQEMIDGARDRVAALFGDPTNFQLLFTQEVQLFHMAYGYHFDSAKPMMLGDVRSNMLGGSPIPSILNITPTHYDANQGCLHVTFENSADPVEMRKSVLTGLQEQARQMGAAAPSEADLPADIGLVDNVRFEMDLESGWPTAIHAERAITLGTQGRVETTEIVLLERDAQ